MNIAQHHQSAFSICVRIYGGIRSLCNITFAHIFSMTISFCHAFRRFGEKINKIIVCAVVVSQESSVIFPLFIFHFLFGPFSHERPLCLHFFVVSANEKRLGCVQSMKIIYCIQCNWKWTRNGTKAK